MGATTKNPGIESGGCLRLAIYQTTNEEYSRFLEATRRPKRCPGMIRHSTIRNSRWWQCPGSMRWRIVNGSASRARSIIDCPPKPSGNAPPEVAWRILLTPGETLRLKTSPNMRVAGKRARAGRIVFAERVRALRPWRQCARMVFRLVRRRILRLLAGAKSTRACNE